MIRLEHSVSYDQLERDAQRLARASASIRAASLEAQKTARETAAASRQAQGRIAAALARLR